LARSFDSIDIRAFEVSGARIPSVAPRWSAHRRLAALLAAGDALRIARPRREFALLPR